jgi:hypothetical protein
MNTNFLPAESEKINDLATEWYFLTLETKAEHFSNDLVVNELLETGLKLKNILLDHGHTVQQPLNVQVDQDTFVDICIDQDGKLRAIIAYRIFLTHQIK